MGTSNSYNTDTGIIMPKGFDNTNTLVSVVMPRRHFGSYKRHDNTDKCPYWCCDAKRAF